MEATVKSAFDKKGITIPIANILPIRQVSVKDHAFGKYASVLTSVREIGVIEPPIVFPQKGMKNMYIMLDGHLRMQALKELGAEEVFVLVATDDDAFTYNNRVNRLAPIQEHAMVMKAIRNGVKPERIAEVLSINVEKIMAGMNLLDGIHPDAVEMLKDKPITPAALRTLKHVKNLRQVEMAQLMVSTGNYTHAYVKALLIGTQKELLVKDNTPKEKTGLNAEEIARMEREMESLEKEFKLFQDDYGENSLHLNSALRYIRRLLDNTRVKQYMQKHHEELLEELSEVAEMESL